MLEVGNGKLSLAENRTHFSMWAMLAAPLLAGNDLPNMKPEIKAILTNRDVIAIDQDPLGKQARCIYTDGEVEVWTRDSARRRHGHRRPQRWQRPLLHASLPSRSCASSACTARSTPKTSGPARTIDLTNNMPIELPSHDILLLRIANPR